MKKLVLAPAFLVLSGTVAAQSTMTLFGVVDATLTYGKGSVADRTQLSNSGYNSSRVGFRGVEDLGGGLSASFWLEAGINNDNGQGTATSTNNQANGTGAAPAGTQGLTFNRRSTVSLSGNWGEARLGRDFSVQYYNRGEFDPFGNNGVGSNQALIGSLGGPVSTRVSNALMYFLPPDLGGFYGELQYYLGENATNAGATKNDGDGGGLRLGYRSGPLHVSVAHARTQYARTATTGDITSSNIGARYDIGALSLMAGYYRDRVGTTAGVTATGYVAGATYKVGAGEIRGGFSSYGTDAVGNPETKKLAFGYIHNLSRRTALYATVARVKNGGGAATALNAAVTGANQSSTGVDLGVRHSF